MMTIQGIGPVDPITKYNKTEKTSKVNKNTKSDSISVSEEAKFKAEIYKATEEAKRVEDIRLAKVEEVMKKLQDPNYLSDRIIDDVATKIMNSFKI